MLDTAPTMATLMPAAIIAYSIAVVPPPSAAKRAHSRRARSRSVLSFVICHPRLQQRHQMCDQRLVRRRHLVLAEPVGPYPGQPLPFLSRDRPLPAPANEQRHQEMEIRIGVAREGERRQARLSDDDTEFLLHLPDQRFLGPLAG